MVLVNRPGKSLIYKGFRGPYRAGTTCSLTHDHA